MGITHQQSLSGHRTTNHSSLALSLKTVPYPLNGPPFKSVSSQFGDKYVIWDHVKDLTEIHVDDTDWSSLINYCSHSIIEGDQISEKLLALSKIVLNVSNHLFVLHVPEHCLHKDLFYDLPRHKDEDHHPVDPLTFLFPLFKIGVVFSCFPVCFGGYSVPSILKPPQLQGLCSPNPYLDVQGLQKHGKPGCQ